MQSSLITVYFLASLVQNSQSAQRDILVILKNCNSKKSKIKIQKLLKIYSEGFLEFQDKILVGRKPF